MAAVSFKNVTKNFGSRVVFTGVSFELEAGARCGLIGPNGVGKSTLLKLLMGALRPDAGEILVDGLAPWRPQVRGRAGFLPEGAPLMGDLTVREHLVLAARLRGLSSGEFSAEEDRLTEALALAGFYRRPAAGLSQGQKRRAALASALLGQPPLLALDEPTSGLDPEEAFRLLALLRGLPSVTTLIVSSHLLGDLRELAGQILVLAPGRAALSGPLTGSGYIELHQAYSVRVNGEGGL
ncbi:MAG: ABC transporter ATP-binding protein [Candidatus Adiutrix sp.]|jgi:ABC-2 type transport system ATP-binding protein|nr:ABC transporter ATP-binding protein [Candidatus Adiutrix sp.]